jgi:hypothetical protein
MSDDRFLIVIPGQGPVELKPGPGPDHLHQLDDVARRAWTEFCKAGGGFDAMRVALYMFAPIAVETMNSAAVRRQGDKALALDEENIFANRDRWKVEATRLQGILNTPQTEEFLEAVRVEAAHQVERWGTAHDRGKGAEDWFWLLGHLAGKALRSAILGDQEKALHHTISSGAALMNWHAALKAGWSEMRPGIDPAERGFEGVDAETPATSRPWPEVAENVKQRPAK